MTDRGADGKFVKGNKASPGRMPREKEARYYDILLTSVSFDDWKAIVLRAAQDAKKGDALKGIEFMAWLCSYALLEPRLYQGSDSPPDDCVTLADLTDVDQAFIARYAQGETLDLSNFR